MALVIAATAVLVLVDSHRSVWMSVGVIVLVMLGLRELALSRAWSWGLAALALMVVATVAAIEAGLDPVQYISTRASAFIDPAADRTSAWRLYVWQANLREYLAHPIVGEGFGAYWSAYVPQFDAVVDVSPHSIYVQTLVKAGAAGLLLYVASLVTAGRAMLSRVSGLRASGTADWAFLAMGIASLFTAVLYQIPYALEWYTPVWIGLALSAVTWPSLDPVVEVDETS